MLPLGLVAVYGSLRKNFHNHGVLGHSELVGTTKVPNFTMYSLGGYPAIVDGDSDVVVEVYSVEDPHIAHGLDCLEGYTGNSSTNFYNRKKVDTEFGEAWIYFIDNDDLSGSPLVESGDWSTAA